MFAGYRGKRQMAALNAHVFKAIRPRLKPRHAMRDTVGTGMAQEGVDTDDVSRVLNHSVGLRVTQGYIAHTHDKEKRLALLKWERRLRAIVDGKANAGAALVAIGGRA